MYTGPYRALRRTLFIGELHTDLDSGLTRARFAVSRPFGTTLQIDVGADWQRGAGMTLELGVTTTLQAVRAVSRNRYNLDEGVRGTQIAEGSLLWDRVAGRIEFGDGRSLGRAGLTGIVFADANGNGTIDPGEFPIPDVRLQIGPRVVTTDSSGRFAVWDLIPFELVIVEVDTLSIRDPMWLPLTTRFTFRPHPNVFVPLPLPFVQSGEVTGRVVLGPAGSRIAGAGVDIRNLATGDVYTTTTFSDGTFYVLGIRPGEYEATVDAADLAAIGASATPARFTVGRTPDTLIIEGIEVRLVRGGG